MVITLFGVFEEFILYREVAMRTRIVGSLALILTGVILVLVNVIANWLFVRWDMTRFHSYSLSAASKRLVRSLDDTRLRTCMGESWPGCVKPAAPTSSPKAARVFR